MAHPITIAETLARDFSATAVERDRRGGTPKKERDALRASGLLGAIISADLGGLGASWETALGAVRTIANADAGLAQELGHQHLLLATAHLLGTRHQFERLARATVEGRWFWGNALNPLDPRASLAKHDGARILRGEKSVSSGARDADLLLVSARDASTGQLVVVAITGNREGVEARDDWDEIGHPGAGALLFDDVRVQESEVLAAAGPVAGTFATLRPLIAQLTLSNVHVGAAQGALSAARAITRERASALAPRGMDPVEDDPQVLATFGDLLVETEAAQHVCNAAARALDAAWARGDELAMEERAQVALAVAAAHVTATRAAREVASRLFDANLDASASTATALLPGLDRFRRALRTLTLHDPVNYKRRELGRWYLAEAPSPRPSFSGDPRGAVPPMDRVVDSPRTPPVPTALRSVTTLSSFAQGATRRSGGSL